jgi:DNA-binding IclR family transcriptional regulator
VLEEDVKISKIFTFLGLTKASSQILTLLARAPALSITELGKETGLSKPVISNAIHSLTVLNWLQREGNKFNMRYSLSMSIFSIINQLAMEKIDQHRDNMLKIQELVTAFEDNLPET